MGYLLLKLGIYILGGFVSLNFLSNFKKPGVDPHPFYWGLNKHGKAFLFACILGFIFGLIDIGYGYRDTLRHDEESKIATNKIDNLTKNDSIQKAQLADVRGQLNEVTNKLNGFQKEYEKDSGKRDRPTTYIAPTSNTYVAAPPIAEESPILDIKPRDQMLPRNPLFARIDSAGYQYKLTIDVHSVNQYPLKLKNIRWVSVENIKNRFRVLYSSPWEDISVEPILHTENFYRASTGINKIFNSDEYYIICQIKYSNQYNSNEKLYTGIYKISDEFVGKNITLVNDRVYRSLLNFISK